jgi:hypothetical protein
MMMTKIIHPFFLFLWLLPLSMSAQEPQYYRNYTTNNGLANNTIFDFSEDRDGFLWIATEGGVSRFDGRHFNNYDVVNGLAANEVFRIYWDSIGNRLWCPTFKGLVYGEATGDTFRRPDSSFQIQGYIIFKELDKANNLILGSYVENKILKIKGNRFEQITTPLKYDRFIFKKDFKTKEIYAIGIIEKKTIVNPSDRDSIYHLLHYEEQTGFKVIKQLPRDDIFSNNTLKAGFLIFIYDSRFYFASVKGIQFWDAKTGKKGAFGDKRLWGKGLTPYISFIEFKGKQCLAVPMVDGFCFMDIETQEMILPKISLGHTVNCIYKDREGGYWIGTREGGIVYYRNFEIKVINPTKGLLPYNFNTIAYHASENWLVSGSTDGRLIVTNEKGQLKHTFSLSNEGGRFLKMAFNGDDLLIMRESGFFFLKNFMQKCREQKTLELSDFALEIKERNDSLFNWSHSFYQSILGKTFEISADNKKLWRTMGTHLLSTDLSTGITQNQDMKLAHYTGRNYVTYFCLSESKDAKVLWLGGLYGIVIMAHPDASGKDQATQRIRQLPFDFKAVVIDIFRLSDTYSFVATNGFGLFLLKGEQVVANWQLKDGLCSNNCRKIVLDRLNNQLFVATDRGVSQIKLDTTNLNTPQYFQTISAANSLPSTDIDDMVWDSSDQKLILATSEGIVMLHPDKINKPIKTPFLNVWGVSSNDTFRVGGKNVITLSYGSNNAIEFQFDAVAFKNGEDLVFNYSLEKDGRIMIQKVRANDKTILSFTLLEFGDYTLHVCCKRKGEIRSNCKDISFQILAPFWLSMPFILLYVLILGAIHWWWRLRIKQKIEQKTKEEKERFDLEHRVLQGQMSPHFIRNSLTALNHFIKQQSKAEREETLSVFSKLMTVFLENSSMNYINLKEEVDFLKNYMYWETLRRSNSPFAFQSEHILTDDLLKKELVIPPMLIQPFLENAVRYGLTADKNRNFIQWLMKEENNFIYCRIEDKGRGYLETQAEHKHYAFQEPNRQNAFQITEKRLKTLQNTEGVSGRITWTDKSTIGTTAQGTIVEIWIPILKKQ